MKIRAAILVSLLLLAGCSSPVEQPWEFQLRSFSADYEGDAGSTLRVEARYVEHVMAADRVLVDAIQLDAVLVPEEELPAHWGASALRYRWFIDGDGRVIRDDRPCGFVNRDDCQRGAVIFDAYGHAAPFGLSQFFGHDDTHIIAGITANLTTSHENGWTSFESDRSIDDGWWPLLSMPYRVKFDGDGYPVDMKVPAAQYEEQFTRTNLSLGDVLPLPAPSRIPPVAELRQEGKPPLLFDGAEKIHPGMHASFRDAYDYLIGKEPQLKKFDCLDGMSVSLNPSGGSGVISHNDPTATSSSSYQFYFMSSNGSGEQWEVELRRDVFGQRFLHTYGNEVHSTIGCKLVELATSPVISMVEAADIYHKWELPGVEPLDGYSYGTTRGGTHDTMNRGMYGLGPGGAPPENTGPLQMTLPYKVIFYADTGLIWLLELPVEAIQHLDRHGG